MVHHVLLFVVSALTGTIVDGKGVVVSSRSAGGAGLRASRLRTELGEAMGEALGCGGDVTEETLVAIEKELLPMFLTLPKSGEGSIEKRSLRYLVHRYFNRQSSLHIRGFEPSRPANPAGWADDDILSQRVPAFVESVLQSKHKMSMGFTLRDAATMVATLKQLVFDSEGTTLEHVYDDQDKDMDMSLSDEGLGEVLEGYIIHWLLGEESGAADDLLGNQSLLEGTIPHWSAVVDFVRGEVKTLQFKRQQAPVAAFADSSSRPGHNAMSPKYSFEDAHRVVGSITGSFSSFWESECSTMKNALVSMDSHHTGRVPISKFYSSGLDSDWRFGESEAYLRELGALDETSWRGKQVIIPNYIQATSNCIVSGTYYSVCCMNDCEAHLDDIEAAIGAAVADPAELLAAVSNLASTLDDGVPPNLKGSLTGQLFEIASSHGGQVPLHGRLFAQWLHYAFPRECPFPHKAGDSSTTSPGQYGEGYLASAEDMLGHASEANATDVDATVTKEDLQWMSQWSAEEELIADYAGSGLRAPWESRFGLGSIVLMLAIAAALYGIKGAAHKSAHAGLLPVHGKSHFV